MRASSIGTALPRGAWLLLVLAVLALCGAPQARAAGEPTGPMAADRFSHASAPLADGRVMVIGGYWYSSISSNTTRVELYDPATNTFVAGPALPAPRAHGTALALPDGRVLLIGGSQYIAGVATDQASVLAYDPLSGAWSEIGSMTQPRRSPLALLLPDGRILLMDANNSAGTHEVFDPATGTSSPTGSFITARSSFAAAVLADGRVLAAGGFPVSGAALASAELWDPATGTWSPTGLMAAPRARASATRMQDGRVMVVAGMPDGSFFNSHGSAEIYDPATGTFSAVASSLTMPRATHVSALMGDGSVVVYAGIGSSATAIASVERYDPATGTWRFVGNLSKRRDAYSITLTATGNVLVSGGTDKTTTFPLRDAEVIDARCIATAPSITPASASFPEAGGSGSVDVTHLPGCAWRIENGTSATGWFTVTSGTSGVGSGTLTYSVAQNTTSSGRGLNPTIADSPFSVTQASNPCASASITPASQSFGYTASTATVSVTASATCSWTVSGAPSWLTIGSGGTGNANLAYSVSANTAGARNATLTIAGRSLAVSQAANPCFPAPTISSTGQAFSHSGGSSTVTITAPAGCAWTVSGKPSWITSVNSGSGNASVAVSVGSNAGAERSATLTIANNTYTVTQAANPCLGATVTPTSASYTDAGGSGSLEIAAPAACNWVVSGKPFWITSASSGTGNASLAYTVAANTGTARSATLSIAGVAVFVSQAANPCASGATISPTSVSVASSGQVGTVQITHAAGCAWSIANVPAWITVNATSGAGSGTVEYTVSANTGAARSATLSIAARSFTVSQAADPCLVATSISPTSQTFGSAGGSGSVTVTHNAACSWSVTGVPSWVTLTSGASGTGSGSVTYTVAANTGSARSAVMTIAGRSFSVSQSAPVTAYCASRANTNSYEWIQQIAVAGTTRVTGRTTGYADFTATTPIALSRGSNTLALTPGGGYPETWRVWIDFNQDLEFSADELVYTSSATSASISTTINVPSTALAGNTRMRISMKYGGAPTACEIFTYGEVEDYTVTIP